MRKTSTVIRRQINRAYRKYGWTVSAGYPATAANQREQIQLMEQDYQAARERERREEGT